ncbi:protein phosphatase 2C domain-containing protein [Pseudanabaena mucicola]|uniref:PPM-type phosphatase domain-containing protein n=1 Tax=Pseudanabaena mucicola FACHB-723 TaxID=2692860 RepID=A0ABR7ZYM6_9CYAN|nr:protein phosphatase 2C domain-containing protein [Pseudanabaena mucicola]MBD2189032.1 hypothetical protein [Pseudanabaena mucicola FACHB-723]
MFKSSCNIAVSRLPSPYGYANFGFKSFVSNYSQKYCDRSLYAQIHKPTARGLARFQLVQSFSVQKAGNAIAECEDMWDYVQHHMGISLALSDGATESSFAREWSKELVTNFVHRHEIGDGDWQNWLLRSQKSWQSGLAEQNLSWFAKRKAAVGAFATFVSLEICSDFRWKAMAIGDSCIFMVRDHQLLRSFPIQNSDQFNYHPRLLATYPQLVNDMRQISGKAKLGDRFYLATDAIACWIFKQIEANQDPWLKLEQISSQDLFVNWVNELRDCQQIVNDDTTLLCLEIQTMSQTGCES